MLPIVKKRGAGMRSKNPELMNEIKEYIEGYYLQTDNPHLPQRLQMLSALQEVQLTSIWLRWLKEI